MVGAELFRFFVFVESGVLVSPVRVGVFDGWGPLRRRVRAARLVGFGFVEGVINKTVDRLKCCGIYSLPPGRGRSEVPGT